MRTRRVTLAISLAVSRSTTLMVTWSLARYGSTYRDSNRVSLNSSNTFTQTITKENEQIMKLRTSSKFLLSLAEPQRITLSEQSAKSCAAWVTNPHTSSLISTMEDVHSWEYYVPETLSDNCKTGARIIDLIRHISTGKTNTKQSNQDGLQIGEWKIGVVTASHVYTTVFLKNYGQCYLNGGVKTMRAHPNPWRDISKRLGLKINRHRVPAYIEYLIVGDRIAKTTLAEVNKINSYNPYIVHHSSGKKVRVRVRVQTQLQYFHELDNEYELAWNQDDDLARQVRDYSRIGTPNKTFPMLGDDGVQLAKDGKALYYNERNLLPL